MLRIIMLALLSRVCGVVSAQITKKPPKETTSQHEEQTDFKGYNYAPPTAEEMAPMRPEYSAELAKIHEPPEMAGKPMRVRKAASPSVLRIGQVMNAVGDPEKATHEQHVTALRELLEIVTSKERDDGIDRVITYGAVAAMACIDLGSTPQTIIGYPRGLLREYYCRSSFAASSAVSNTSRNSWEDWELLLSGTDA